MNVFFTRLFIIILLSFLFLFAYGAVCDYLFTNIEYVNKGAKREWISTKQGEEFDYAILGSSRAEGAFDIRLIDSLTDTKGINLGVGGAGFADNYLVLSRFINKNKVKTVFLQVDMYCFDSDKGFTNSFNIPDYLPYWNDPKVKEVLHDYIDDKDYLMWSYLPFSRYLKFNKYFNPFEIGRRVMKSSAYQTQKFDLTKGTKNPEEKEFNIDIFYNNYSSLNIFTINPKDEKYLIKIISLCNENNIKLVTFRAPEFKLLKSKQPNRTENLNYIGDLLKKNNIQFVDEVSSIEDDYRNFVDATHLSNQGVYLFTKNFINYNFK
jgi:hypothetical protein